MSDGSLGRAGSSWINPYSDAYAIPPPPSHYTHTHMQKYTHTPSGTELMSVEE